jgi:hypothetical protein
MRTTLALAPLLLLATPAAAQHSPASSQLPPEITDGRSIDQLGTVVGAIARAFLDLPVGEVEAAIENRPVTRADQGKTIRSVSGMSERELQQDIREGTEVAKAGTQAVVRSLPVITRALDEAGKQIGRAIANLPSPAYPRQ